jgi:hypothetical protein
MKFDPPKRMEYIVCIMTGPALQAHDLWIACAVKASAPIFWLPLGNFTIWLNRNLEIAQHTTRGRKHKPSNNTK